MSALLPDLSSWECSSSGGLFRLLPWGLAPAVPEGRVLLQRRDRRPGLVPLPPGGLVTTAALVAAVAAVEVLVALRQLALTSPTRSAGRLCRRQRRSGLSA